MGRASSRVGRTARARVRGGDQAKRIDESRVSCCVLAAAVQSSQRTPMRSRFPNARVSLVVISSILLGACTDDLTSEKPIIAPSQAVTMDAVVGDWFDASDATPSPSRDLIVRRTGDGYVVWNSRESFDRNDAGRPVRLGYI